MFILPDWPDAPDNIGALATTRHGGVSKAPYHCLNLGKHVGDDVADVEQNRALVQANLPGRPAWISQVHGVAVVDAAAVTAEGPVLVADASYATRPGVVSAVLTADCLPVLFADLQGKVVAAAHAGWRGLAAGVLQETIKAMRAQGAGKVTAWMGPAIGPRQFEVGQEVVDAFGGGPAFVPFEGHPGKYLADIFALARTAMAGEGVTSVWGGQYCTATLREDFYSYRRDGVTGRQASLIWIR
ncbi:MAG: peptidoglycan editing factor PgeF [Pseudomonadota bacterium]